MTELSLLVDEGDSSHFAPARTLNSRLFAKQVALEFLPRPGDSMFLFGGEAHDSFSLRFREVYWQHDGRVLIEMQPIVYLPTEEAELRVQELRQSADRAGSGWAEVPCLWRATDDDPVALYEILAATGWGRAG